MRCGLARDSRTWRCGSDQIKLLYVAPDRRLVSKIVTAGRPLGVAQDVTVKDPATPTRPVMRHRHAFAALFVFGLAAAECRAQERSPAPAAQSEVYGRETRYPELMKQGGKHLAAGELEAALKSFESADREQFTEAPNYDALVHIAEVQCRLGRNPVGLSNLEDFRCMLDVETGKVPCYLDARSAAPRRNPALSVACFERMCWEAYLASYERPTPEMRAAVAQQIRDASRVEKLCRAPAGASRPPTAP